MRHTYSIVTILKYLNSGDSFQSKLNMGNAYNQLFLYLYNHNIFSRMSNLFG